VFPFKIVSRPKPKHLRGVSQVVCVICVFPTETMGMFCCRQSVFLLLLSLVSTSDRGMITVVTKWIFDLFRLRYGWPFRKRPWSSFGRNDRPPAMHRGLEINRSNVKGAVNRAYKCLYNNKKKNFVINF
jgi:hypothetical protein